MGDITRGLDEIGERTAHFVYTVASGYVLILIAQHIPLHVLRAKIQHFPDICKFFLRISKFLCTFATAKVRITINHEKNRTDNH